MVSGIEKAKICDICGIKLKSPFLKYTHIKQEHPDKLTFTRQRKVLKGGEVRSLYSCNNCGSQYSSIKDSLSHYSICTKKPSQTADLAGTLKDIPESIGRGFAADLIKKVESMECEVCHTKIYYPRDATQITCPKCGATYTRHEKPKQEELPRVGDLPEAIEVLRKFNFAIETILILLKHEEENKRKILAENSKLATRLVEIQNLLAKPT